jgi:copper transport protein
MTRIRQIALTIFFSLALLVPARVYAHAELVRSEPADGAVLETAPDYVRLYFSEPIEREFFALEVYASDRTRVDQGNARISPKDVTVLEVDLPPLGPDTYTVLWRVLSIDGHVVRGSFAFSAGGVAPAAALLDLPATGAPFELGATVRWLTFLAAFLLIGGLAFSPLVLWPAARVAAIEQPAALGRARRGFLLVAWPAIVFLLGLSLLALLVQAADVTGQSLAEVLGGRALTRLLSGTRYGIFWIARLALLFALAVVLALIAVEARPRRAIWSAGLLLGAALLFTIAASGHASAVPGRTGLAIAADWVHLTAGAFWIGGLVQLVTGLLPALRGLDGPRRRVLLARAIQRFSWLAGLSVLALVATGVFAGLLHVPTWQSLVDTVYGAALAGKLLLFLPLLALGAVNLLVMHRRFVRASARPAQSRIDRAGPRLFRAVVLGEVALAVLVLGVTGILSGLPPATTAPAEGRPFTETQQVGDLAVALSVSPNQAGDNRLEVALAGANGQPVDAGQVTIAVENLAMDMGRRELAAQPTAPGQYVATGNALSMAGQWMAEVEVEGASGAPAQAMFHIVVGEAPGSNRVAFSPLRILSNAASLSALAGLLAVLLGGVIFAQRARWRRRRARLGGLLIGGTLLLLGTLVAGNVLATAYRRSLPNPVPATPASLARGQEIYEQNCATCHGMQGRGDGPAGFTLRPRPADFRIHMAAGHTDAQLFDWVQDGVDGTAMPAFGGQLSEEEIWHVINYIRTFAEPASAAR